MSIANMKFTLLAYFCAALEFLATTMYDETIVTDSRQYVAQLLQRDRATNRRLVSLRLNFWLKG